MKKLKEILGREKKKPGRPSVRGAILKVYESDPKGEHDYKDMLKILDGRYALSPKNPAHVNKELMKLTRAGVLIRKPTGEKGKRRTYRYRLRKPGE